MSTRASVTEAAPRLGGAAAAGTSAVLLATAPTDDGDPAAGLAWEDTTIAGRLVAQLRDLGVGHATVITRPGWEDGLAARLGDAAEVRSSADVASDLRTIAELARAGGADLVVLSGEIVTQREALAGLLADPRIATGVLTGGGRRSALTFRVRTVRGRVTSAASPYHSVRNPTIGFLGILKVAEPDRPALAQAAERLADLLDPEPGPAWVEELRRKGLQWRVRLATAQARGLVEEGEPERDGPVEEELEEEEPIPAEEMPLDAEQEARLRRRLTVAHQDVPSLLLVGLVRGGAHVSSTHLRRLFWARPFSPDGVERAAGQILGYDEEKVLLDSSVKPSDGFFTTFFVSPYSKYIARWGARRGWSPNAVTLVSLVIGALAAGAFATGERWGMIAGALLLQASFTADCVDGQLARFTRQFSRLGAWLDATFDRTKEYLAFAGLAIGGTAMGQHVWLLAGAALTVQTVRHLMDFAYATTRHEAIATARRPPLEHVRDVSRPKRTPGAPPRERPLTPRRRLRRGLRSWHRIDELGWVLWIKKFIGFPIGERFAVISLTAALFSPRVTFIVLLAWGGTIGLYQLSGRIVRSLALLR